MSQIDLSALRMQAPAAELPRRPRGPRVLTGALVLLALAVLATFVWPLLVRARAVPMAAVLPAPFAAGERTHRGTAAGVAAEAVGWVEADPFPIVVRPLVSGHVQTLDVLEGAVVEKDRTLIATLASAERLAAHERALVLVAEREAALLAAHAALQLAQDRLRQNADARLRLAETRTRLADVETRLGVAREQAARAIAMRSGAEAAATAQRELAAAGSTFPVALERAIAEAEAARAAALAAEAEQQGLAQQSERLHETLRIAEQLANDPADLRGAVAVATAGVQQAEAALAAARTERTIAARELDWTRVLAPADGVVLRLLAQPGDMVGHEMPGIVALYDPRQLRARIDVPLDAVAAVHEGQAVELQSQVLGDQVVRGVVQRLQHESDLLKNTLQVKVGLIDPPPLLRPETLCRARFLASAPSIDAPAPTTAAFRVPSSAVQQGSVFVFDPARGRVRAVPVEVLAADGGRSIVRGELSPAQQVALAPVHDGEAVRPAEFPASATAQERTR